MELGVSDRGIDGWFVCDDFVTLERFDFRRSVSEDLGQYFGVVLSEKGRAASVCCGGMLEMDGEAGVSSSTDFGVVDFGPESIVFKLGIVDEVACVGDKACDDTMGLESVHAVHGIGRQAPI